MHAPHTSPNPSPLHCQTPLPILIHRDNDTQPRYFTRTPHRHKMHRNSRPLEPHNPQTPSTQTKHRNLLIRSCTVSGEAYVIGLLSKRRFGCCAMEEERGLLGFSTDACRVSRASGQGHGSWEFGTERSRRRFCGAKWMNRIWNSRVS